MTQRIGTCIVGCTAAFVVFLDATVITFAFPAIAGSFPRATSAQVALTVVAYAAVLGALLLPAGPLADHLGHRRVFLPAFAVFALASGICGLAGSIETLIVARIAQAAAAGCMAPTSLALMLSAFRPDQRALAVAIWSSAAGFAALVGPAVGGVAVEALGWRSVFFLNIPVGVAALVVGTLSLNPTQQRARRPDTSALLLSAVAAGAFTAGLYHAGAAGWRDAGTWALLFLSLAATVLCAARGRVSGTPLVGRTLLRSRSLQAANAATFLTSVAGFALMFANMLFLSVVWGYSAVQLGLAVTPGPILTALLIVPAGRLADRFGVAWLAVPGALLLAAGALWFSLQTGRHPEFSGVWLPGSLLTGAGIGLCFPTLASSAVAPAPETLLATSIALNGLVRQVAAVVGVTLVVIIASDQSLDATSSAVKEVWLLVGALAFAGACVATRVRHPGAPCRRLD